MSEVETVEKTEAKVSREEMTPEKLREELHKEFLKKLAEQGCTTEMLDVWKQEWGPLGFLPIGDTVYVVRPLLRKEWKEMNKTWQAMAQSEEAQKQGKQVTPLDTEEDIAARATLWPQLSKHDLATKMPAGIATALSEAISQHAGFVPNATAFVF